MSTDSNYHTTPSALLIMMMKAPAVTVRAVTTDKHDFYEYNKN